MGPEFAAFYRWLWQVGCNADISAAETVLGFPFQHFAEYLTAADWTLDLRVELSLQPQPSPCYNSLQGERRAPFTAP